MMISWESAIAVVMKGVAMILISHEIGFVVRTTGLFRRPRRPLTYGMTMRLSGAAVKGIFSAPGWGGTSFQRRHPQR